MSLKCHHMCPFQGREGFFFFYHTKQTAEAEVKIKQRDLKSGVMCSEEVLGATGSWNSQSGAQPPKGMWPC